MFSLHGEISGPHCGEYEHDFSGMLADVSEVLTASIIGELITLIMYQHTPLKRRSIYTRLRGATSLRQSYEKAFQCVFLRYIMYIISFEHPVLRPIKRVYYREHVSISNIIFRPSW
jgi:hypothetical protein